MAVPEKTRCPEYVTKNASLLAVRLLEELLDSRAHFERRAILLVATAARNRYLSVSDPINGRRR